MIKFSHLLNHVTLFTACSIYIFFSNTALSENITSQLENVIEFNNSSYESYFSNNEKIVLKSRDGKLNLDNNEIILTGEVEGKFSLDGEVLNIHTASLRGNLLDRLISSKEEVFFEVRDLEIISSAMEITQKAQEDAEIIFWNANLKQENSDSRELKAKANKIKLFLSKNLIVMEGNAVFYEDNMKIISDELHYDLNKDRILKSVNAKIINNL